MRIFIEKIISGNEIMAMKRGKILASVNCVNILSAGNINEI
jgi:hypothetical protein